VGKNGVLEHKSDPTVDSREGGTSNADVDDDRSRCRPGILATSWLKGVTGALVHHDGELEGYPLRRSKPVEAAEQRGNVIIIVTCLEDKLDYCIHVMTAWMRSS